MATINDEKTYKDFSERLNKAFAKLKVQLVLKNWQKSRKDNDIANDDYIANLVIQELLSGVPINRQEEYARLAFELIEKGRLKNFKDWLISEKEFQI